MSAESDHAIPIAFARAASQAQEIEAILQEMLIAAEVANDTKTCSFEGIAAKIEKLSLGPLKKTRRSPPRRRSVGTLSGNLVPHFP